MTVVVRRPGGPLAGLVTSITYRTGEQPRTSVEKILPSPETGLWVNLNRDAFRSFGWSGDVRQVPGTMVSGPAGRAVVMEFEEGHGHVAVLFALGAASRFLGVPASVLCDDLVPLPELWGASPPSASPAPSGSSAWSPGSTGRPGRTGRRSLSGTDTPTSRIWPMSSANSRG